MPAHHQKTGIMRNYRADESSHEEVAPKKHSAPLKEKIRALQKQLNEEKSDLTGLSSSYSALKFSSDREITLLTRKTNELQKQLVELAAHYRNKMNLTVNGYQQSNKQDEP